MMWICPVIIQICTGHLRSTFCRGAKIIKEHLNLYAVYLTNHGCGPDGMISHLFAEIMGDKPYLKIEVDEHQSKVGG